jgi:DNA-binding transcriptional regulator LsrR (DeoR family)
VPPAKPRPPEPQTHRLTDEQVRTIFVCYRDGVGQRELAKRFGINERAVNYLLAKHGVQRRRNRGVMGDSA